MRGSCDLGGVSDGSRLVIYQTLPNKCPSSRCARAACMRHASVFIFWVPCTFLHPTYLSEDTTVSFLAFLFLFIYFYFLSFVVYALFLYYLCSHWSFLDIPTIFSCPADNVRVGTTSVLALVLFPVSIVSCIDLFKCLVYLPFERLSYSAN